MRGRPEASFHTWPLGNDCIRPIGRPRDIRFAANSSGGYPHSMDYFTRAWALGDLPDEEFDKIDERYRNYLRSLDQDGSVFRFATSISLNDAYVDRLNYSEGALSLRLLTGDLQRGYWRTLLRYGGGRIVLGRDAIEQALTVRPTEIWYDEFSPATPRMVHRFLLVKPDTTEDRGEVHIEFDEFAFSEIRAVGRSLEEV